MKKIKKETIDKIFNISVFLIYIVITFIIVKNHECYEDEAQSWLIARDLNFLDIIKQMKYEGHSFIWYFLIAPFAKIGLPMQTQNYISWGFCVAAVYVILKKSPFNKLEKVLLVFSSGLLYFYSSIARPYCMIPLLIALLALRYKTRKEHPYQYAGLVILLANTHLIMVPMAGMLVLDFWIKEFIIGRKTNTKEQKKNLYISFAIVVLGILMYLAIATITLKYCQIVTYQDKTRAVSSAPRFFEMCKDTITKIIGFLYGRQTSPLYFKILSGITAALCLIGIRYSPKQAAIFWIQVVLIVVLHTLSWFLLMTRVCVIIYMLMYWVWIQKQEFPEKENTKKWIFSSLALILLICISFPATAKLAYRDVEENFSTGKMTAEYIKENIEEGSIFLCLEDELQQSIIGYLPKDKYIFYSGNAERKFTFITWDKKWKTQIEQDNIINLIKELQKTEKKVYILAQNDMLISNTRDQEEMQYNELISTRGEIINGLYVRNEVFEIYEINIKQ